MAGDDDLSALLPRPPQPAPARREAAITEALRRFDGGEARPAVEPEPRRSWLSWPVAGGLAAASLAIAIAVPAFLQTPADPPERVASADKAGPDYADARAPGAVPAAPSLPAAPESGAAPAAQPRSALRPESPRARPTARGEIALAQADIPGAEDPSIVVTGSRIRRQDLTSTTPVTVVQSEEFSTSADEMAATARGDWNACTIDDPARDVAACRGVIDPGAAGPRGQAAAHIADGLTQAWQGEQAKAIEAFDRAIASDRRSAPAYLNRGLVRQARGDLDRALADLDRAIRYDPRSARAYYHRSRLLRQRGDIARGRADMARAIRLDPGYALIPRPAPER